MPHHHQGGLQIYHGHETKILTVPLLLVPARAQPIAHSAVLSRPMMGLLGDNRLAAGHDLGGLLRAAKHGQTASATGPSPRGQDADRHCVACRSRINLPLHRLSVAGTARLYSYSERWGTGRNFQPSYQQIGANDNAGADMMQ